MERIGPEITSEGSPIAFLRQLRAAADGQLQQHGGQQGAADDAHDHGGKDGGLDHPGIDALLGHHQGHLAPGHHADAGDHGLVLCHAGEATGQAAADDLGDHGGQQQHQSKDHDLPIHGGQVGLHAHAGKEDGGEDHVGGDGHLLCHELAGLSHVAHDKTGKKGTGNIGHAEELLGAVGHDEAEGQGPHRHAAAVPVVLGNELEELHHSQTHQQGEEEEARDLHQHQRGAALAGAEAGEEGQHHDAQNIVDEGGTEQGRAGLAFQLAHLVEGLHGDAHGGGGEDGAHKGGLQHVVGGELVLKEEKVYRAAQHHGDNNAHHGDAAGLKTGLLHLVQVRIDAGQEHDHDDTDLGGLHQKIRALQHAEAAGPQNNASQQCAHHLGHVDLLRDQTQKLCGQQNDG